jgi:hypothetical protein
MRNLGRSLPDRFAGKTVGSGDNGLNVTGWWDNQSMITRQVLIVGGIVGLLVSSALLGLIWFGVAGVLDVGHTDLMYVFWPSSVMLVVGWWSTILGIMITVWAVVINCLLYMALAYVLL